MWGKGKPQIQSMIFIHDYTEGGLRHLHFNSFLKVQKIMWIKRFHQMENSFSHQFLSAYLPNMKLCDILSLSMNSKRLHHEISIFYQEILDHWYSSRRDPKNVNDILEECIWFFIHIKVNNSSIFYQELRKVVKVRNLLHANGDIMSANEI